MKNTKPQKVYQILWKLKPNGFHLGDIYTNKDRANEEGNKADYIVVDREPIEVCGFVLDEKLLFN